MIQKGMNLQELNEQGKKELAKSKLLYCSEILNILSNEDINYRDTIYNLLQDINLTEEEFKNVLKGSDKQNIVFYDHTLKKLKEIVKKQR